MLISMLSHGSVILLPNPIALEPKNMLLFAGNPIWKLGLKTKTALLLQKGGFVISVAGAGLEPTTFGL